jgi:hypothetical protein
LFTTVHPLRQSSGQASIRLAYPAMSLSNGQGERVTFFVPDQ